MTVIGLFVIGAGAIAATEIARHRHRGLDTGILITLAGLLVWVLFFLLDLAIMQWAQVVRGRPVPELTNAFHVGLYRYGGTVGVLTVAFGVIISHRHQQAATSRHENYIEFIEHLAEPCMIVSGGRITAVNRPLEDMIYRNRDDLVGHDPYELWDELEFNLAPREEILKHLLERQSWWFISKLNKHDGTTGHAEVRVSLLDAEREEVIVFITDITERVEAQQRLRENEIRLATAHQIAGLGYLLYRIDNDSIEWSDQLLRIFGLDNPKSLAEYPTSVSRWALIHPDDEAVLRARIDHAMETGIEPPEIDFKINRPDDELRHLRAKFGVLKDNQGKVEEIFAVVQDLTEFVRAEARLRHAQKMEAVGELTGGVSHDFNNLLQVILGNTELIEDAVAGDVAESVQAIKRSAQRGSELTQLLLAFSRRQILEPRMLNVNECVEEILPLLRRTLGESITIDSVFAHDLEPCKIDPGQLENCILNLAINAQHAMNDGGTLRIETGNTMLDEEYAVTRHEVTAGPYVQLTISDTGAGMPEEIRARAFEPFFTTKEVGKGSGLGLSMVYGFVKQSGGHIEIDSHAGKGTSVKLFLPVAHDVQQTRDALSRQALDPRFSGTVLLVEDDAQVAALTRRFLESFGLAVIQANDVEQARAQMRTRRDIDLLLTDVVLPGRINGPDLARELRELHPAVKVLFMSGYTESALSGHSDFALLHKPFRKKELAEKLAQALSG